jgi:outer membrane scaffolding protein for murein synthesis (MipA/OmpV family)
MSSSDEVQSTARGAVVASWTGQRRTMRTRLVYCVFAAAGAISVCARADDASADSEHKLVTGRVGAGALTDSRYSGGTDNQTFPVPLAEIDVGDFAYVDYWEAGLFVLSNHAKTLGLAVVATPRLGFSSSDGERLAGMRRRLSSIEAGLSINYGSDDAGVSLGYVHDVTGASRGGLIRLLTFKHFDITSRLGFDAYAGVERLDAKVAGYYYGVTDHEATMTRPAYHPGDSTVLNAGLHFNFDFGHKSSLLFGYEPTLFGRTVTSSPIVEQKMTSVFFIGYGWRL